MNRTDKTQLIDELHSEFKASPHAILVDFTGLSVPLATEFRRRLRQAGSRYRVVKNTLALRAVKDTPLELLSPKLDGVSGIAYAGDDPVALAKVLVDFSKDNPALRLKAGVIAGGGLLDSDGLKALSALPSLPELRARLLGLLKAPASQLVRLLQTPATQAAQVLRARQEKLES